MKSPRRIAVLRALQLGDMLCVVPALRALRAAHPQTEITLIGLPWATGFIERFSHYVDDFLVLPRVPGMPEPVGQGCLDDFLQMAHARRFDLAIQLHGSGIVTNGLLRQLGATRHAGFYASGQICPDPARFLLWQDSEHEVLRALRSCISHLALSEFPTGVWRHERDELEADSGNRRRRLSRFASVRIPGCARARCTLRR